LEIGGNINEFGGKERASEEKQKGRVKGKGI